MLPESKLQVKDNIILIKKGIQSLIYKFFNNFSILDNRDIGSLLL